MAKGYPDYFGQSIWPKYGTLNKQGVITPNIMPGATGDIYNLSMRAVLHSGWVGFLGLSTDMFITPIKIEIDGTLITQNSANDMLIFSLDSGIESPASLNLYNLTDKRFGLIFVRDLSFMSSFRVYLTNGGIGGIGIGGGLYYYTQI